MAFPIAIYKVAEQSMKPHIEDGAYVLVNKSSRRYAVGDAIVLRSPEDGMVLVKRITDISGSSITVIGDNAALSRDSRAFGSVRISDVIGKVICVI